MNKNQTQGAVKNMTGKAQEEAGELVGNQEQQAKGVQKQVAGKAQESFGNAKESVNDARDAVKDADKKH